jgi:hypothetical protein
MTAHETKVLYKRARRGLEAKQVIANLGKESNDSGVTLSALESWIWVLPFLSLINVN